MMKRLILVVIVVEVLALAVAAVWAQNTITLLNTRYNAEGTGNVLTLTEKLFLPPGVCDQTPSSWSSVWSFKTTGYPTMSCATGTNTNTASMDFTDASTQSAYTVWMIPSEWTGALDARIYWLTSATTGNVVWQLATICVADAETTDPAFNTASTVTDAAKGTTIQLNIATITGVTTTGCAAGEFMYLKLLRDPAHASDTIGATALLWGVELTYRRAI